MKLSVIIPVYNEKNTLERIVDLVRAVEGIDKEIIIVDDGSTDGSVDVIKRISDKYPDIKTVIKNATEKEKYYLLMLQSVDIWLTEQIVLLMIKWIY